MLFCALPVAGQSLEDWDPLKKHLNNFEVDIKHFIPLFIKKTFLWLEKKNMIQLENGT